MNEREAEIVKWYEACIEACQRRDLRDAALCAAEAAVLMEGGRYVVRKGEGAAITPIWKRAQAASVEAWPLLETAARCEHDMANVLYQSLKWSTVYGTIGHPMAVDMWKAAAEKEDNAAGVCDV